MSVSRFKSALYAGGVLALLLLVTLLVRSDLAGIHRALALAGWPIFWLLPYRLIFFVLYALAWELLLRPYDPRHALGLPYLTWIATVREGIDRLLPVASVGGALVGVRLVGWRGVGTSAAGASTIVEVLLTLAALWVFTAIGLTLLAADGPEGAWTGHVALMALAGLAVPAVLTFVLHYGSVFARLEAMIGRLVGVRALAVGAAALDAQVRATLRRTPQVLASGALQLLAMLSGVFEVWYALRLFGHPVDLRTATIMESLTQAARHVAFIVPGALGVQELSLMFLGHALGVGADLALTVSLVKRARELIWGIPALAFWQWQEGLRLHRPQHYRPERGD